MITIWYVNIEPATEKLFCEYLDYLPQVVRDDITRFKFFKDQKFKLFGRLLVWYFHFKNSFEFNWYNFKKDKNEKPYLQGGKKFNITHSGNYVFIAFSENDIGIDLEIVKEIDTIALSKYMHHEEKKYIISSTDKKEAFYKVWTRKEAYLKAKGIGITNGLNKENCLQDSIKNGKEWFIYSTPIFPDYQFAVCTSLKNCHINKKEIGINEFSVLGSGLNL